MKLLSLAALLLGASLAAAQDDDRQTVVVAPLKALSPIDGITILTEELRTQVARHGRYKLVTPEEMQAVDDELVRQLEGGCDEAACVAEVGGALGAQFVITGQIGKLGSTYNFSLKLVNIETVSAQQAASSRSKSIEQFLERMPALVVDLLGPSGRSDLLATEPSGKAKSAPTSSGGRDFGLLGGVVDRINAETDSILGRSRRASSEPDKPKKDKAKPVAVEPIKAAPLKAKPAKQPARPMTKTLSLFGSSTNLASLRFDWRSTRGFQWEFDLGVFSGLGVRWALLGHLDRGASLNLFSKVGAGPLGRGVIWGLSGTYRRVMPSRLTFTATVGAARRISAASTDNWGELALGVGKSF
jgi:TolB-like protein